MNNAELIKALRLCGNYEDREGCAEECPYFYDRDCPKRIMIDAADALEAADKRIAELEAQIPKEGEWIATSAEVDGSRFTGERCSRCGWWKSMGIYNYCPNCGARMQTVTDCHTLNER